MPIWLRLFTFNKLKDHYDSQNKQVKQAGKVSKDIPKGPSINKPTYTAKISKK